MDRFVYFLDEGKRMNHPFGDLLTQYRARKHGLSQAKLAETVGYDPSVIGKMCKGGKELTGPSGRDRVVRIIEALHEMGVLIMLDEANALLAAADMPPLYDRLPVEAKLIQLLRKSSAAAQSLPVKRTNLPAQLTSFIGREQEIVDLAERVKMTRLLTLTGSGGVGKSRLALEVAGTLLDLFADGVWLVELAPLSDPTLVPQTIATVLKLPEQPGRTHLDVLIGYVETKHVLLVLDNCEHLIDSCASLVEALLQRCSKLHVLATSRDRLRVPGEVTHHVPSLTTPDGAMPPYDLLRYEAVRLFRERAITSQSLFEWSASNAFAVAQICRRLDGIPLAIELSTARLNVFTTEQIAERLTDRFNLLVTGSRTALRRHQTLRAAIAWSYDLLTEPEQTLLMRLSVFAGGFTAEAAEFVSGQPETLTLLSNLIDKSLVIAEVKGKTMRYRMLETIRQFANDLVSELGDVEEARDQHLKYFLQLAERAEPELRRADQIAWLDRLETELDNFRAAREWSLERERHVEAGLRLAAALLWLWHIRSRWREGSHWLERELLAEACTRGAKPHSEARTLARVQALNAAVFLIDNYAKRVALAEEALALSRKLGDAGKSSMAFALWNLADLAREQQKYSRVRMLSEESLALYREMGDKFGIAQCFYLLGYCALMTGDYERARALQEETLALRKEIGDIDGAAFAHYGLGQVAFGQGDFDLAAAIFEKCLALYDEVGSKRPVAWVLFALGSVARARGEYEQAVRQSEQALALAEETGDVYSIASSHHELGQTACCQGDYGQAALQYEEALASFRELGDKSKTAEVLCGLGNVALVQGVQEQSAKQFEEALALGRDVGSTFTIADAVFGSGRVAQIRSDFASAEALHKEALALRHGTHDQWTISLSLDALAAVAVAQGQVRRAARLFGTAETSHELWRFTQSPFERDLYERAVAVVRSQLDESTLAAAWEEGQAMTMDQAVEYALSDEHNE